MNYRWNPVQCVLFILACILLSWRGVIFAAQRSAEIIHRHAHVHVSGGLISLLVIIILVLILIKILKWLAE
jgi:high-affinity K+ transport system ATPase subunit B